jgi:hypothetical protein
LIKSTARIRIWIQNWIRVQEQNYGSGSRRPLSYGFSGSETLDQGGGASSKQEPGLFLNYPVLFKNGKHNDQVNNAYELPDSIKNVI